MARYGETPAILLSKLNPVAIQAAVRNNQILTPKKALLCDSVSLANIGRTYGKETPIILLQTWVDNLGRFVGVKEKADEYQLRELAELFYQEAFFLKIVEIGLFFNNVKKGKYGKFFGAIDPLVVLTMLSEFLGERTAAYRDILKQQEKEIRENSAGWEKHREYYAKIYLEKQRQKEEALSEFNDISEVIDAYYGIKK